MDSCPLAHLLLFSGLLGLAPSALAQTPPQPTALTAEYRNGQTFLTFTEAVDISVDHFRLYRYDQPIDATNLPQATLLQELWPGSAEFHADRYYKSTTATWQPRYLTRFVIQDDGPELSAGTGLLVWTLNNTDFGGGTSGSGYYAVTSVDPLGVENQLDFSAANSIGPISEQVDLPAPVLSQRLLNDRVLIYTQFLDLRRFNPTFSAPNANNDYYGLDQNDPLLAKSLQYAYTYAVVPPDQFVCSLQEVRHPIVLELHGFSGLLARPLTFVPDPTWCNTFRIYPIDPGNCWYFGHARDHDYRTNLPVPAGDTIVNYTEERVLRMVQDLRRDANFGPMIDDERIYVEGHSMGASGTLAMALRYPDYFAAAHASQPMTNYLTSGDGGGSNWKPDVEIKWGLIADQNPVDIQGDLASHLQVFDGTPAFDWANHQVTLVTRRGDEFVPIGIDHALADTVIEWTSQGQPAYAIFDSAHMCWSGEVRSGGHQTSNQSLLPGALEIPSQLPFADFRAVRSETVPGISGCSANLSIPPTQTGAFNADIDWSASWNSWDGTPIDTPGVWQMSLRTKTLLVQFANVTPRRLQNFEVVPGRTYRYIVERISDNSLLDSDLLQPDADGLLTVPMVEVDSVGVRVRIERLLAGDVASISLLSGGTQNLALRTSADYAGKLYWLLGSTSGTTPGIVLDGQLLALAYDPWFEYTLTNPNSAFLGNSLGSLDGRGEANPTINLPSGMSPGLAGLVVHHAAIVIDIPGLENVILATEPESVTLEP
jgi:pimeloyl-ACP methyl ester carboxylesterase